jgi:hypothetical protein
LKKKQTKKCRIYRLLLTFDKINVIVRSLLDFRVSVARFFLPKKVVPLACGSETNNYAEAQPSSIKYYLSYINIIRVSKKNYTSASQKYISQRLDLYKIRKSSHVRF